MKTIPQNSELLQWFKAHSRVLPWRQIQPTPMDPWARDPYRVAVAECMLQQTQVRVVLHKYEAWMNAFPTVQSLAEADENQVLSLWAGLGYYRRARNLHAMAQAVCQLYSGVFPQKRQELIGPYTAGAILSLAHNLPEAILDGNLIRVFCRYHGWAGDPLAPPLNTKLWAEAQKWAQCGTPRLTNEALMELGALVCTPKNPQCSLCPLQDQCSAHATDCQNELPTPKSQTKLLWSGTLIWVKRGDEVLLVEGKNRIFLKNTLGPIILEDLGHWPQELTLRINAQPFKHAITKYKITMSVAVCSVDHTWEAPAEWGNHTWIPTQELSQNIHASLFSKGWDMCP
jgi:A/G-specific adenine glycosylase